MTRDEAIELLVNATYSDEWQGNEQLTKANLMAIEALQEPNMISIKLEKRYPESRDEDITDAFMQGYLKGIEISTIKAKAIEALSAEANQSNGRLINADTLMDLLKARKQFFVDAYGGSFHCMSEKDKARCDEIDACIASIVNAPTASADTEQVTSKLNNPCDSLLTDDSYECREQKSKLESADEVVRCKDCKRQKTCKFAQWQGNYGYCSNGERRKP